MYCKSGGGCRKATLCAEKVCAGTVEADVSNAFVGDFDEVSAKTIKADSVTTDQIVLSVPAGSQTPTVEIVSAAPGQVAPDLALPVFGVPFGGLEAAPCAAPGAAPGAASGEADNLPVVAGSNSVGIMTFSAPIEGGTVYKVTYAGECFPATSMVAVTFTAQHLDMISESYVLPALPQVVDSTNTYFSVLFPDPIVGESAWAYQATEIRL